MTIGCSTAVTRGVRVNVRSAFVPERSSESESRYFFVYQIEIRNEGTETIQLISRHWRISNGFGEVEEIRGLGVIGQQPVIEPGRSFEYSSFCPLSTAVGTMEGTYQLVTRDGAQFDARIETFTLAAPNALN